VDIAGRWGDWRVVASEWECATHTDLKQERSLHIRRDWRTTNPWIGGRQQVSSLNSPIIAHHSRYSRPAVGHHQPPSLLLFSSAGSLGSHQSFHCHFTGARWHLNNPIVRVRDAHLILSRLFSRVFEVDRDIHVRSTFVQPSPVSLLLCDACLSFHHWCFSHVLRNTHTLSRPIQLSSAGH